MKSKKVLVTDSLFIKDKHVKRLEEAGFEVERLDKPAATEDELIEALKGKVGYILGGVEKVTDKVIDSTDGLKAIVFTGTGVFDFIPGHETATKKGIAIGAAPYLNAHAVAEFGMAMTLLMCRDMIDLARGGSKTFETVRSLSESEVGIVGLGHVGEEYAGMAIGMGASKLSYFSRTKKPDTEKKLHISYKDKGELFKTSDVVFVAIPADAGENFISSNDINAMKKGSLLVSIAHDGLIDKDALHERLKSGDIRAALDEPIKDERLSKLPLGVFYTPNASTAYNTNQNIEDTSSSSVETLINLINTGDDKFLMNPDYKSHK